MAVAIARVKQQVAAAPTPGMAARCLPPVKRVKCGKKGYTSWCCSDTGLSGWEERKCSTHRSYVSKASGRAARNCSKQEPTGLRDHLHGIPLRNRRDKAQPSPQRCHSALSPCLQQGHRDHQAVPTAQAQAEQIVRSRAPSILRPRTSRTAVGQLRVLAPAAPAAPHPRLGTRCLPAEASPHDPTALYGRVRTSGTLQAAGGRENG